MQLLSVVICSHNPRPAYLSEVLSALRLSTLPLDRWELLLVDNASREPLRDRFDLSWHPNGRCVVEKTPGLSRARVCGVNESRGDLILFIDDDNVLEPTYLERTEGLAKEWPVLGCIGAGRIIPRFEQTPAEWTKAFMYMLAVREAKKDAWSNVPYTIDATPWGAGMCVRRNVFEEYARRCSVDQRRLALDRTGSRLVSCGDMDIAYTACDMGLGMGVFTSLGMLHLIPPSRLELDYLVRLSEGNGYSDVHLRALRGEMPQSAARLKVRLKDWVLRNGRAWMRSREGAAVYLAFEKGRAAAIRELCADAS